MRITLSKINADIGGIGGHTRPNDFKLNSAASLNYFMLIVSCIATSHFHLQRTMAAKIAIILRIQGFIHPATFVPGEQEYNKGYEARVSKLNKKFKPLAGESNQNKYNSKLQE
jgi:fructose 1,6-bisphosphate aldolase/phosphatase